MEDYDAICDYLLSGEYPTGFSKNQKRVLRRKCQVTIFSCLGIYVIANTLWRQLNLWQKIYKLISPGTLWS